MPRPFFTILIPTRARPDLLRDSLESALCQDFEDYEVIVSDNWNDDRTKNVLARYANSRLRCIRPETLLPMPDHWEFVSRHANGTYVMFLTDRSVLKRGALRTIYGAITGSEKEVDVCSWSWSVFDDQTGREYGVKTKGPDALITLPSANLCADLFSGKGGYPYSLPRGLNSCYRFDLMQSLQRRYGTVFRPMTPDFTSAFMLLAHVNEVLFINQPLFISQGVSASNGGGALAKTASDYLKTLGDKDWFPQVPIKAALVENAIYQDYLSVRELAGGFLSHVDVDWAVYFEKCYIELIEKTAANLLSRTELGKLYAEWSEALAGFDHSTQTKVNQRLRDLFWMRQKAKIKRSVLGPSAKRIKRKLDGFFYSGIKIKGKQTILEAAGFGREVKRS